MPMKKISAKIGLPFGLGEIGGDWEPDTSERDAAWEMYIELVTRVGVVELLRDEGLLREALTSLYSLFGMTREILRRYGPTIAQPKTGLTVSFGHLAIAVLNQALRPVLSTWHPALEDHEALRPPGVSRSDWEQQWSKYTEMKSALNEVGSTLRTYAGLLGEVCEAKSLLTLTAAEQSAAPDNTTVN